MGTDSVIYFRADGNLEIATGHIMRCLSVARACLQIAPEGLLSVCFLVSDRQSKELVQSFLTSAEPIPIHILENADYRDLEKELPALIALFRRSSKKPVLFLDSYFVTLPYLQALAPYATIAYMDDLQKFDYPVDLLINYDVMSEKSRSQYEAAYSLAGKCLLGAAFAPLRAQFSPRSRLMTNKDETDFSILITSGGSDPYHTCLHLLQLLTDRFSTQVAEKALPLYHFDVIVGKMNPDKDALQELASTYSCITLHENVTSMASLMSGCKLAFSAAGTTLYELCALGIPTAAFVLADNQLVCAKAFQEAGAILLLGDVRTEEEKVLEAAEAFVADALAQPKQLAASSVRMQELIDGLGAERIAKEIIHYL